MRNTRTSLPLLICSLLVITFSFMNFACAKKPSPEKIAIRINDYTLTAGEFNNLFTELKTDKDTPEGREMFLENLINRKLLLQEGQRLGLDKQKDFLKSIENFWEHALLKIIIDNKIKETSGSITVTEQEIQDSYNKWVKGNPDNPKTFEELYDIIKWQLTREKQTIALRLWMEELKRNAKIKVNKKALGIE